MITPADITNVRLPIPVDAPTLASSITTNVAQETLSNLTSSAVGQLFQAQVLSQLEDGSYLVNVANNALRMALPAGTAVGETLDMTLLATDPRPAFLLEGDGASNSASASLSNAAKLIDTVLQAAQQAGTPATLTGKTPLVTSSSAAPPELASALKDSIEFSGVFYESHVNQWTTGERPLTDLLREPQMQAQQQGQTQQQTPAAGTVLQRPPASETELTKLIGNLRGNADARMPTEQALNALISGNNLPKEADTLVKSPLISQADAQTIHLQLNTLEQQRIAWQGELWPGQRMEWEISEDRDSQKQGTPLDDSQRVWQSVVRFDLPKLGKISATIHLSGGHVRMQINAASANASATLQRHGDALASALDAAGSPLDSFIVKQDEQA